MASDFGVHKFGLQCFGFGIPKPRTQTKTIPRLPAIIDKQARRKEDAWPKSTNAATCAVKLDACLAVNLIRSLLTFNLDSIYGLRFQGFREWGLGG